MREILEILTSLMGGGVRLRLITTVPLGSSLRGSSEVFLGPRVALYGLTMSFSVCVLRAQNFPTLFYFLCSVSMLLNSQMAEIN